MPNVTLSFRDVMQGDQLGCTMKMTSELEGHEHLPVTEAMLFSLAIRRLWDKNILGDFIPWYARDVLDATPPPINNMWAEHIDHMSMTFTDIVMDNGKPGCRLEIADPEQGKKRLHKGAEPMKGPSLLFATVIKRMWEEGTLTKMVPLVCMDVLRAPPKPKTFPESRPVGEIEDADVVEDVIAPAPSA